MATGNATSRAPSSPDSGVSRALERLRAGEISLDEYLDDRVAAAAAHLRGRVTDEQLATACEVVREQLLADPVMVELVQRVVPPRDSAAVLPRS
jgi:hypothetical protein